jgi:hypothetical protein
MFRQDYRINKIFLPLLIPRPFLPLERDSVFSGSSVSREKNPVNPVVSSIPSKYRLTGTIFA